MTPNNQFGRLKHQLQSSDLKFDAYTPKAWFRNFFLGKHLTFTSKSKARKFVYSTTSAIMNENDKQCDRTARLSPKKLQYG